MTLDAAALARLRELLWEEIFWGHTPFYDLGEPIICGCKVPNCRVRQMVPILLALLAAAEERDRLREALRPFVSYVGVTKKGNVRIMFCGTDTLTVGHVDNARVALGGSANGE